MQTLNHTELGGDIKGYNNTWNKDNKSNNYWQETEST